MARQKRGKATSSDRPRRDRSNSKSAGRAGRPRKAQSKRKDGARNIAVAKQAESLHEATATKRVVNQKPKLRRDSHRGSVEASEAASLLLRHDFRDSEIVIGLVGAVGTELTTVISILRQRFEVAHYNVKVIEIAEEVIPLVTPIEEVDSEDAYAVLMAKMDAGNRARKESQENSVLALGTAMQISKVHEPGESPPKYAPRTVHIVKSLKHPAEVHRLREIYSEGFFLLGVHADRSRRENHLIKKRRMSKPNATKLIERDEDEAYSWGQRVTDSFHLSDFFIRLDSNADRLQNSVWRIVDILLGHPHRTPMFDEFAMFLAFTASLRSADLSRQVGAVIARDEQIVATGANDCPRFGGGLYWPDWIGNDISDHPEGRDHTRGEDSNKIEQQKMLDEVVELSGLTESAREDFRRKLERSRIRDLTEFGRVVHAEMEALLSCARSNTSTAGATLYSTTFPCHNCAKHIIAAGIQRVVYIEPYLKSKAGDFYSDSISLGYESRIGDRRAKADRLRFEPFFGVGPRRFFDLFSMRLGSGREIRRKEKSGKAIDFSLESSYLRLQMLPYSYLELEAVACRRFEELVHGGTEV